MTQTDLDESLTTAVGINREVVGQRKDDSTFPVHLALSEVRTANRRSFAALLREPFQ